MSRVGVLGGSFNPPHRAHLACAVAARRALGLERVLLVPSAAAPHKVMELDPGAEHRVRMCELLVEGVEGVQVSRLEVSRGGPSYTVDTLRALHERSPEDELTLIVGGDMARTLASWREPQAIARLSRLAVVERPGAGRDAVARELARLDGARISHVDMEGDAVSSTLVRERVAEGAEVTDLVGPAVAGYLRANGLYGAPA